jgi:hypothetical protein
MRTLSNNPAISRFLYGVILLALVVAVNLGVGLFFLTDATRLTWRWELTPFNALFLGSVYLAAIPLIGMLLLVPRWSLARMALTMLLIFSSLLLFSSLLYLSRFRFQLWQTWLWFALYLILPLATAYELWCYRHAPPAIARPTPARWRVYLRAQALVLGLYGSMMLLLPVQATAFWPWAVDAFHGRLYSAIFLALAGGSFVIGGVASRIEIVTLGLVQTLLGIFAIIGLLQGNALLQRVRWTSPGSWLWIGIFVVLALTGIGLVGQAHIMRRARGQAEVAHV